MNVIALRLRFAVKPTLSICSRCVQSSYSTQALQKEPSSSIIPKHETNIQQVVPDFPNVIVKDPNSAVGFWKTEKGLKIKDMILTNTGRGLRLLVSIERYNNMWESCLLQEDNTLFRLNEFDETLYTRHGPEWAACLLILRLGGALKLVTDDRWIDDAAHFRTPKKKDCTIDAIDLRNTCVTYDGLQHLNRLGYVRYLNVGDCEHFTNECMARLHPLADTLQYLDVSGTQVSPEGLTFLRIFPHLKWINLSRLKNPDKLEALLPFLYEILPPECVVVLNDEIPASGYGSLIPFRSSRDPNRDDKFEKNPNIGDIVAFNEIYGENSLRLQDVTHIHQMWKTPLQTPKRQKYLSAVNTNTKIGIKTLVKYIKKAEKYPPLI
ncbi:uncharacterized protein LOC100179784 [Ciona intestinalis]